MSPIERIVFTVFFVTFIYSCYVAVDKLFRDDKIIIKNEKEVDTFSLPTMILCPGLGGIDGGPQTTFDDIVNQEGTPNITLLRQYDR